MKKIYSILSFCILCSIPILLNETIMALTPKWNFYDYSKLWLTLFFLFLLGVELNKPTHFTVSTKGAGKANLDCNFSGPTKGEAVKDFEVINNHDNTHTVKYTPVQQVQYHTYQHENAYCHIMLESS